MDNEKTIIKCRIQNMLTNEEETHDVDISKNMITNFRVLCHIHKEDMDYLIPADKRANLVTNGALENTSIFYCPQNTSRALEIDGKIEIDEQVGEYLVQEVNNGNIPVIKVNVDGYCPMVVKNSKKGNTAVQNKEADDKKQDSGKACNQSGEDGKKIPVMILVVGVLLVISALVFLVPKYMKNKEAQKLFDEANVLVEIEEYDEALEVLNQINKEWNRYDEVILKRKEVENKEILCTLNKYIKAEDYETIIAYVQEELEEESLTAEAKSIYNSARENYKNKTIEKAERFIKQNEYDMAIELVERSMLYIEGNDELEQKILEIGQQKIESELKKIGRPKTLSEYEKAMQVLIDNEGYRDESLEIVYATYLDEYRDLIISKAKKQYKKYEYEKAVELLDRGKNYLKNDEKLREEIEKYEELAPVALVDLEAFHDDYGSKKQVGISLNDKLGNNYLNCIEYAGGSQGYMGERLSTFDKRDTYVIKEEYSTFKATIFVPESRSSYWDTEIYDGYKKKGSFSVRIFGDGKLLYQSPVMTTKQYPVEVKIDVTGVEQLQISWATFSDVSAEIGIADAYLYK